MRKFTRLAFSANARKPAAEAARRRLVARAAALGFRVVAPDEADVQVVLGGDGTILRAVRERPDLPVLGFNLGGLGYLASVERRDFDRALDALRAGRFRLSSRAMLAVDGVNALNDVVFARELTGHATVLDLAVDGRPAARYLADGLVVATPTGSTAYSLSAGGPVLMPDAAGFVITPMNPHALGIRPMVVPDGVTLSVTVRRREVADTGKIGVYADGENVKMLSCGETLEIARSAVSAKIVELEGHDPYEVLSRKLGWSGTNLK